MDESLTDLRRTFDRTKDIAKLDGYTTRGIEHRWDIFRKALAHRKPRTALDFGAGSLRETFELSLLGIDVTAVDLDESTLNAYADDYEWINTRPVIIASGSEQEIPAGPFDLIIAFDVIEHLAVPETYLRALVDRLAPGGCIFLIVPSAWSLWEVVGQINLWTARWVGREIVEGEPHLQFRTPGSWERLFRDCDLAVAHRDMALGFFCNSWSAFIEAPARLFGRLRRSFSSSKSPNVFSQQIPLARFFTKLDERSTFLKPFWASALYVLESTRSA